MSQWDGEERRDNQNDHDMLTRIDANVSNLMRRVDDHLGEFKDHVRQDNDRFKSSDEKQDDIKKYIWMGVGIVSTVVVIAEILIKKGG